MPVTSRSLPVLPAALAMSAALMVATPSWAGGRVPVQDAKALMVAAIDAANGQAQGVLVGDVADAITRHFKSTTPIFIDVSTERRYTQAGCSRLKVRFWQDGVQLPGVAAPRRQTLDFGINYCRDGLPPRSLL